MIYGKCKSLGNVSIKNADGDQFNVRALLRIPFPAASVAFATRTYTFSRREPKLRAETDMCDQAAAWRLNDGRSPPFKEDTRQNLATTAVAQETKGSNELAETLLCIGVFVKHQRLVSWETGAPQIRRVDICARTDRIHDA